MSAAPRPWRALELYSEQLLICTDSGCRPARPQDLGEVIELLPELLMRQERESRGHQWRRLAEQQKSGGRA